MFWTGRSAGVLFICGMIVTFHSPIPAQLPAPSFNHLKRDVDLFSSTYFTLAEDPYGFIWFGSHSGGGLYRYDGYDLVTFQAQADRLQNSIAGSRITRVYFGSDSTMYVGTAFGFTRMDPVSGHLKNFNNNLDSIADPGIGSTTSFCLDTFHDILWIGSHAGLQKMKAGENAITLLSPANASGGDFPKNITQILQAEDEPNRLWISSYEGLYEFDISSSRFAYHPCPQFPDRQAAIYDMYLEPPLVWISTNDGSIMSYNADSGAWKIYPVNRSDAELKSVYGLARVNENECWLSTEQTVGRFNITTGNYEYWTHSPDYPDGLLHNGGFRDIIFDRHGRLWVASWHGIQFAKQAFLPAPSGGETKVAIIGVDIFPVLEVSQPPLLYTQPLTLQQDQRDVTFKFVLPNPLHPGAVRYQFMLEGHDRDWIDTDQRLARYSRLSGGDYVFRVRGREDPDQEWTSVTSLPVHIEKRVAEFWWFWATLVGVGLMAAYLLYYWLVSRARKEERLKADFEHKLSEIQMQALRAQMNPHFLFNSLNSIKYFAITKSKDETATYLSKFALLVRSILNNSKSRTISLKDELEALKLYIEIEHLRLDGKFDYNVEIDKSIHISQAQIPPMILQPFVENAIWHGLMHKDGRGFLLVQVKDMGDQIQCIIEDNGIGRKRAAELKATKTEHKESVGMKITSDRIELINRIYKIDTQVQVVDLVDENGGAAGTRIVIHIPLIRDEEE